MKKRILTVLLIVICFGLTCEAQELKLVEKLPDGEAIITIDGVEMRAITAEHARRIAEGKAECDRVTRERDLLAAQNNLLKRQSELALKDRDLADASIGLEQKRADQYKLLYEGEHNLRLAAEQLGHRGRVSKFFDNPITQIGLKIGWQGLLTYLTIRR